MNDINLFYDFYSSLFMSLRANSTSFLRTFLNKVVSQALNAFRCIATRQEKAKKSIFASELAGLKTLRTSFLSTSTVLVIIGSFWRN